MKAFATIESLIEERAQAQHRANLERGGVFNADGSRFSDLGVERQVAAREVRFSPLHGAIGIEGFGIVKPNASLAELLR